VLRVLDATLPLSEQDSDRLALGVSGRQLTVINKVDLIVDRSEAEDHLHERLLVSAATGEGLTELRTAILGLLGGSVVESNGLLITNARHHDLLRQASIELAAALDSIATSQSEEMVLVPLHNALRSLGEITGETTTEEILSQIFATFCIGK
jgi:tRNA modification GTPase